MEIKYIEAIDLHEDDAFDHQEKEHDILCRTCGHRITTIDHIIAVNGQHRHTFTNPAGHTFDLGCYSHADGCYIYGVPTVEYTWFQGFGWCYAFCAHCATHLGWLYQSDQESFYGLIVKRLIENIRTH
ncbi:MAG: cereblon family protein [Nitrospirota bacterium]